MLSHAPSAPSVTASMAQRNAIADLRREAGLMAQLRHPNVCMCECPRRGRRSDEGLLLLLHVHLLLLLLMLLLMLMRPPMPATSPHVLSPGRSIAAAAPRPADLGACMDPPCLVMEYCNRRSVDLLLASGLANPKVGGGRIGRGCT